MEMNPRIILASQETHDPYRQRIMRERASEVAKDISKQVGVLGIMLTGSVARGPVTDSSDLDLHVIISNKFTGNFPEWTFRGNKSIIENLHIVYEAELLRGWHMCRESTSLASWFRDTKLGDELYQFIPLWWDSTIQWRERLPILVANRQRPDIVEGVARCYAGSARACVSQADSAFHQGASLDGHHQLRLAFQLTLTAAMIQRGWIIRGSKKRIEIACTFLPDAVIENLLTIGLDIIGLNGMTPNKAAMLCKERFQYRTILLNELRELKMRFAHDKHIVFSLDQAIRDQEAHEAMAYDYYLPLVEKNIILGPINHIRCFSGLPRVPQLFISCLYDDKLWPIQKFRDSKILGRAVRDKWLEIMAFSSTQQQYAQMSLTLNTAIDNLNLI